jgi:hypothetical protein
MGFRKIVHPSTTHFGAPLKKGTHIMNTSLNFRLLCAAAALGITAGIFSTVSGLANYPTESGGTTTLMALAQADNITSTVVLAMAD